MITMMGRWLALGVILWLLSACQTQEVQLPTLARLPDVPAGISTTIPPDNFPPQQDTNRATLPPPWTATASITPTPTPITSTTPTFTPSATITDTPTPTATALPTIDPQIRAVTSLLESALQATILPTDFVVPAYEGINVTLPAPITNAPTTLITTPISPAGGAIVCQYFPSGGFATVFANNPDIASRIGCAVGNPPDVNATQGAYQAFEGGFMVWAQGTIYVFYRTGSTYHRYNDTFQEGIDPQQSTENAPTGLIAPVRGFLKVWTNNPTVRDTLGWALSPEQATTITTQLFTNGMMLWAPLRNDILVLLGAEIGTWRSITGRF